MKEIYIVTLEIMAQILYKDARIVIVKFTINEYEKLEDSALLKIAKKSDKGEYVSKKDICTKVPGCVEKLLRKITQVRDIIDKQDFVPKVSQISPLVSGI